MSLWSMISKIRSAESPLMDWIAHLGFGVCSFPGSPVHDVRGAVDLLIKHMESKVCKSSESLAKLHSVLFSLRI